MYPLHFKMILEVQSFKIIFLNFESNYKWEFALLTLKLNIYDNIGQRSELALS